MPRFSDGTEVRGIEMTLDGALCVWLKNNTGHASIKGELVRASNTLADAVDQLSAGEIDPVGAVYDSDVAEGEYMRVAIAGIVQVLLQDNDAASLEDWVGSSASQAGRAIASALPSPPTDAVHFREIGHSIQAVTAGTDKLCRIIMHFN